MKDNFGRSIEYLRVSLTDRCNFKCEYCVGNVTQRCKIPNSGYTLEEIYYIINLFIESGIKKIRFTGGEPLLVDYLPKLIQMVNSNPSVQDLSITTNGSLLLDKVDELYKNGLKRINISVDTLDVEKFHSLTGGDLQRVLEGIYKSLELGVQVKINFVLMKDFNDHEIEQMILWTKYYPIEVRFIEFMPIGHAVSIWKKRYIPVSEVLNKYQSEDWSQIPKSDLSSTGDLYKLRDYKGSIGLIHSVSNHFCNNCNRIRLTSKGGIRSCLFDENEINILNELRKGNPIKGLIENSISTKPKQHYIEKKIFAQKNMYEIGG